MEANKFLQQGSGIITLCGSTRFFFEAMEANRQLTFQNWIVLMCGSWGHSYHKFVENTNTDFTQVKRLHFHKIAMSNAIIVVTDNSQYIGKSTKAEMQFADYIGLPIFFYDGTKFFGDSEKETAPFRECSVKTEWIREFEEQYGLGC